MPIDTNNAISNIKKGIPILIYEPGENEISMMVSVDKISYKKLVSMKKYASGDISIFISHELSEKLGLPYMHDLLSNQKTARFKKVKKSSLSILMDHKEVKTGSSLDDKLLLIKELSTTIKNKGYKKFVKNTSVPGHLKFFVSHKDLLNGRKGHTELNISLLKIANKKDDVALVACSLMNPDTGKMIRRNQLKKFKELSEMIIISKNDIEKLWKDFYGE